MRKVVATEGRSLPEASYDRYFYVRIVNLDDRSYLHTTPEKDLTKAEKEKK